MDSENEPVSWRDSAFAQVIVDRPQLESRRMMYWLQVVLEDLMEHVRLHVHLSVGPQVVPEG